MRAEAGARGVEAARLEERGEAGSEQELAGQRGSGIVSACDGIARRTLALAHASPTLVELARRANEPSGTGATLWRPGVQL